MTNESQNNKNFSVKNMTLIGLMAALICILGPFSISLPVSPVPITLATLILYFSIYVLGMKRALLSCVIYMLLGLVGLPVFSGYAGGVGKVVGPTGGYLLGYLLVILIAGMFIDKWTTNYALCILGLILGTAALYLLGSLWLAYQNHLTFQAALAAGTFPFLIGDSIKIILTVIFGPILRKRLIKAGLF